MESTTSATSTTSDDDHEDQPNNSPEVAGYSLNYRKTVSLVKLSGESSLLSKGARKMILRCKSCGRKFDSTFSVDEFSSLPSGQFEAGTLHLCPDCGNLSIYELKDYQEPNP